MIYQYMENKRTEKDVAMAITSTLKIAQLM